LLRALPWREFFDPTGAGITFAGLVLPVFGRIGKHKLNNLKSVHYPRVPPSFLLCERFGTDKNGKIKKKKLNNRLLQVLKS